METWAFGGEHRGWSLSAGARLRGLREFKVPTKFWSGLAPVGARGDVTKRGGGIGIQRLQERPSCFKSGILTWLFIRNGDVIG